MIFIKPENYNSAYPIIKETIPQSSLGYNTNNKYPSFPPLMSDGRAIIGSWQPESVENTNIIEKNNIKSNWEYRRYLTNNSKEIMEYNFREACNDAGYTTRQIDIPSIQSNLVLGTYNTPKIYKSGDNSSSIFTDLDPYLSREQLNSFKEPKVSPN
jgi:hypothetical protein